MAPRVMADGPSDEAIVAPPATIEEEVSPTGEPPPLVTPGTVTSVQPGPGSGGEDLPAVVDRVPGVVVRRAGGPGSRALVSIRGSNPTGVLLLVDGVPVDSAALGSSDLAEWTTAGLSRIDVYRGFTPPRFGSGGLGGAIDLRSSPPPVGGHELVVLGLGAYLPGAAAGASRALEMGAERRLGLAIARGDRDLFAAAEGGIVEHRGDYVHFDDNGTELEPGDDRFRRRVNNDDRGFELSTRLGGRTPAAGELRASAALAVREAGISGIGAFSTHEARARRERLLVGLDQTLSPGDGETTWRLGARSLITRRETDDPLGELATSARHSAATETDLEVHGGATSLLLDSLMLETDLGLRRENHLPRVEGLAPRDHERRTAALAAQLDWAPGGSEAWTLTAGGRAEGLQDLEVGTIAGEDLLFSPRGGVRFVPWPWLTVRGAVGRYERRPSFVELFGDGAALAMSQDLVNETGVNADLGLLVETRGGGFDELSLGATGFLAAIDDLVQFVPNSQSTYVARNLGQTLSAGVELDGRAGYFPLGPRHGLELAVAYTFTDARNVSEVEAWRDRRLPGRPEHQLDVGLTMVHRPVRLTYEVSYQSGAYLDPHNLDEVPPRLLHDVRCDLEVPFVPGLSLSLAVTNLTDRIVVFGAPHPGWPPVAMPVQDLAGQPLPGATAFLGVRWESGGGP